MCGSERVGGAASAGVLRRWDVIDDILPPEVDSVMLGDHLVLSYLFHRLWSHENRSFFLRTVVWGEQRYCVDLRIEAVHKS